jgi:hypothetical protein
LQKRGWTTGDDDPTQQCDYAGCKALRKPFTIYCLLHILYPNKIQRYSTKTEEARATQVINKSMNRSWEVDRSSNFEKYLNRKCTVVRVIAVDVEGRMAQGILTQITAIEAESCNNIFNIRISNSDHHAIWLRIKDYVDFSNKAFKFLSHRPWSYNVENLSGTEMSLHDAMAFVSRTIQPMDILLVWHTGFRDVSNIRESLVKEGFEDVLPPNDNVSRLPYVFRHNLTGVSVALESPFPLIFPQHPLRHFSHDAWYDSMKTIVMANEAERFVGKKGIKHRRGTLDEFVC